MIISNAIFKDKNRATKRFGVISTLIVKLASRLILSLKQASDQGSVLASGFLFVSITLIHLTWVKNRIHY